MKFKLDENLPVSSAAILTNVGHDVDTVTDEGLVGAPDRDVVAAATAAGRILVSLDRGLGDIRAYPPGSHAGIVVLRLTDQSATSATKAVSDLATLTDPDSRINFEVFFSPAHSPFSRLPAPSSPTRCK